MMSVGQVKALDLLVLFMCLVVVILVALILVRIAPMLIGG